MHISTMIVEAIETHFETNLGPELTLRNLGSYNIQVGRLQDNPERPAINLMVHIGRPRDDRWIDQPAGNRYVRDGKGVMAYEMGEEFPIGEIGGGRTWLRRFTVEGSVFFTRTKEDRLEATQIAHTVRGLVEYMLTPFLVIGLEDEFKERAYRLMLGPSQAQERGGPKSHIWDFWVYFTVETSRS